MKRFLKDNRGIEATELAAIIALFVVIVVVAFGAFGSQLSAFIGSLAGRLGF